MTTSTAPASPAPSEVTSGQGPAAAVAAAATAAPAAPAAAPAKATLEGPAAPPAEGPITAAADGDLPWAPSGDAGLDYALGFVAKLGFDAEHPAIKAAEAGDFGLLKAHLAQKGQDAQGWEQIIALGEQGLQRLNEAAKARGEAVKAEVVKVAGGEEQWAKVHAWASENAEPAEKAALNAAINMGGLVTRAVAAYLTQLYGKATGVTDAPPNLAPGASASASTTGALSPREFVRETQTLRAKLGANFEESSAYKQLVARRQAWRAS